MKQTKTIAIVTATRAEYGLLRNIITKVHKDDDLELKLWVTGTHLVQDYGMTVNEIIEDGYPIDAKLETISQNHKESVVEILSRTAFEFGKLMEASMPDMIVVLGDRYELLPICNAAVVLGIPIAHISGGEITEGAIDDVIRHSITKMSTLHFPGCEDYRARIIQMGEEPERVFNYGDVGIENIKNMPLMSLDELSESLGVDFSKPYALVTYHPVTAERGSAREQAIALLEALRQFEDTSFIITKANADAEGDIINELATEYADKYDNMFLFPSLGIRRYLSAMSSCKAVIGNSSSGIVEAPAFGVPTVNIGNRQKGRLRADSILDCEADTDDIVSAIKKAFSDEFADKARHTVNPYGDGETSTGVVNEIKRYLDNDHPVVKKFYDIK